MLIICSRASTCWTYISPLSLKSFFFSFFLLLQLYINLLCPPSSISISLQRENIKLWLFTSSCPCNSILSESWGSFPTYRNTFVIISQVKHYVHCWSIFQPDCEFILGRITKEPEVCNTCNESQACRQHPNSCHVNCLRLERCYTCSGDEWLPRISVTEGKDWNLYIIQYAAPHSSIH